MNKTIESNTYSGTLLFEIFYLLKTKDYKRKIPGLHLLIGLILLHLLKKNWRMRILGARIFLSLLAGKLKMFKQMLTSIF